LLEELPKGGLEGYSDSDRLSRAIGQIIDNAVKFTPRDGRSSGVLRERHWLGTPSRCVVADSG
jgi:signal transduction histidine kinase